ncbi:hypothetical protein OQA88_5603 [Cercophora sp. LCS_1]
MHLVQLRRPLTRAAVGGRYQLTPTTRTINLAECFAQLRIDGSAAVQGRRYASVKSQGAYKLRSNKTIPKKLGAKKTGDQYVIPGNIIYKQRGTIWHAGENTILGRDHTIHAAVAGYVKYYRDPKRHPKRQYIGVVFDKNDTLPYPEGAPRKRKLGLKPVPRKEAQAFEETVGPSGIPLSVTRHEDIAVSSAAMEGTAEGKGNAAPAKVKKPSPPRALADGNSVIAALIEEKVRARAEHREKQRKLQAFREQGLRKRMGTRVLRLQDNYSYRETNWEIGRLVGDPGSIAGTEKTKARKLKFRVRRKGRRYYYAGLQAKSLAKLERRKQYKKFVWEKRIRRTAEAKELRAKLREEYLARNKAIKEAKQRGDVAELEALKAGKPLKVEQKESKDAKPSKQPKAKEAKAGKESKAAKKASKK